MSEETPRFTESRKSGYVRKLLQELGVNLKLAGAGVLALAGNETFNGAEATDRLPVPMLLLLFVLGITLVAAGVLFTAEAER